ncbi:glucosamine-6-phosphate deaminase [Leifsonia sp. C5G2]|uniref:glucosamine-6-phosphate deaminase n=1 Tax=Leifsonia sp. C5G2 TaxID=2735269 RepID=UPI0015851332|nr:glucosamine-6-phosphate deaminase [Leifsonia sp. C5G2]NUU05235.1 glucosamine-6-phosphate deaminase [Leifsonia sp. C5G2]
MTRVVIARDAVEAGDVAGDRLAEVVRAHRRPVLGFATGSTPTTVYRSLARRVREGEVDVAALSGFALDEYVGLPAGHPESYRSVIDRDVVEPLGLRPGAVLVPDGSASRTDEAAREYDDAIRAAGGVHLQLLGIGSNGHIGFNEPGSSLASRTRVKRLSAATRADNARFFDRLDDVPTHCVTQGLGTILEAEELLLLAFGESKAAAVAAAVEGPVSSGCPGSVIQLHPRVTVILDQGAASRLAHREYYEAERVGR